jgi:flagellar protein FliS
MTYAMPRGPHRRQSAQSYASVGLETEVLSASPTQLITLLFNGARAAIMRARLHMENGNVAERGKAISKAIEIVDAGLKAAVNKEAGGEVAQSLINSYELISYNLLQANLRSSSEKLDIAERMLVEIGDAWKQATEGASANQPMASQAAAG